MLVYKYYCRPADEKSEAAALDEIFRYVQARNGLLRLKEKWLRIQGKAKIRVNGEVDWVRVRDEVILPEFRAKAAELRTEKRVGRKATPRAVVHCVGPKNPRAKKRECNIRLPQGKKFEARLESLNEQWDSVEITESGLGRSDREELAAADSRALYADFVAAGGSYATWWLAEAASKEALRPLQDEYAGRAGILPERMVWGEDATLTYCGTAWTIQREQWRKRPVPAGARIAQAWLQRRRTSSPLLRKPRYRWDLVVVLDIAGRSFDVPENRTAAGLDLAWRQDDDKSTLRVAYVADETGAHRPVKMTATQYSRLQHAESLQRLADQDANILRKRFGVPANTSHKRLCELAGISVAPVEPRHKPPLPTSEDSASAELAEHIVHLMDWAHGERSNALQSRDEHYLREVRALCMAYHTIYIEKMKATPRLVQKSSTRKKKSDTDNQGGVARDQRQSVAPFTALRLLQSEARKFGTLIVEVNPAYTSIPCPDDGADVGPTTRMHRECPKCHRVWDLDHLAAINLLRWGKAEKPVPMADAAE